MLGRKDVQCFCCYCVSFYVICPSVLTPLPRAMLTRSAFPFVDCGLCGPWHTRKQLRIDQRIFKTPSNRKLDVNVVQSNYHIELTPR